MIRACPRCGSSVVAGQEYCLGCGARLTGRGIVAGPRELGRGWASRAGLALAVAAAGAALAVAVSRGQSDGTDLVTAVGGFATLPTASTLPSSPVPGPEGMVEWPPGEDGWTVVLVSIPQTKGRRVAVVRARQAKRKGLTTVGILDSSRYASLHPGYWVVFSGLYASEAEATSALERARKAARTSTVRRIVP